MDRVIINYCDSDSRYDYLHTRKRKSHSKHSPKRTSDESDSDCLYKHSKKWRSLRRNNSESDCSPMLQNRNARSKHSSLRKSNESNSDSDYSAARQKRRHSSRRSNNESDYSPARQKRRHSSRRNDNESDHSPARQKRRQSSRRRSNNDSHDYSPERQKRRQSLRRRSNSDSDYSPERQKRRKSSRRRSNIDPDCSPERQKKQQSLRRSNIDSDYSPERQKRRQSSRRRGNIDSDYSPERQKRRESSRRRCNSESDYSPERQKRRQSSRRRSNSVSDYSPERQTRRQSSRRRSNSVSDYSPERQKRRQSSRRRSNIDSDCSPERQKKQQSLRRSNSDSDCSPETQKRRQSSRRRSNRVSDYSPERQKRRQSSRRRSNSDSDYSPERQMRIHLLRNRSGSDSHYSPARQKIKSYPRKLCRRTGSDDSDSKYTRKLEETSRSKHLQKKVSEDSYTDYNIRYIDFTELKCPVARCGGKTFPSIAATKRHWQSVHTRIHLVYQCSFCWDVNYRMKELLRQHYLGKHKDKGTSVQLVEDSMRIIVSNKLYICPGRIRPKRENQDEHVRNTSRTNIEEKTKSNQHFEYDPEECICPVKDCEGKTFPSVTASKRHWGDVHEKYSMHYHCSLCLKEENFKYRNDMKKHYESRHTRWDPEDLVIASNTRKVLNKCYVNPGIFRLKQLAEPENPLPDSTVNLPKVCIFFISKFWGALNWMQPI